MNIHKHFLYTNFFVITLSLYGADATADVTQELQRIFDAAQQKAAAEIKILDDEIDGLDGEINTRAAQVEANSREFQQLKAQRDAAVADLDAQFTQRTQANRDAMTLLQQGLEALKRTKKQQEQKKERLAQEVAELIASYVIVHKDHQERAPRRPGARDSAPKAGPATSRTIRKPSMVPAELWERFPESWQQYFSATE